MCKILILNILIRPAGRVAVSPDLPTLQKKCFESSCVLCSAVAYCCGAVAPCAIAAVLGRFLPRLGPLVHSSGPFFLSSLGGATPRRPRRRRLLQRTVDRRELVVEVRTKAVNGGNDRKSNTGGDQTVFDR